MKKIFKILALLLGILFFLGVIIELFIANKKSIAFIIAALGNGVIFLVYALRKGKG